MKEINKALVGLAILFFVCVPALSMAQPVPPVGGSGGGASTGITYECSRPGPNGTTIYGDCTFDDLIEAVKKFFKIAIPIALGFSVVVIAYVGFEYMQSGGNPGARAKANGRLVKVGIGIFFMLAAWVIVNLILNALTNPCTGTNTTDCIPRLLD